MFRVIATIFAWLCIGWSFPLRFHLVRARFFGLMDTVDDKAVVQSYFNNEGFRRWNNIYSLSPDVNKVQQDIRFGHQTTINKVLSWFSSEDVSRQSLCDAGCGVGSLSIPAAATFKQIKAYDISEAMINEAKRRSIVNGIKNVEFKVSDIECVTGKYNTVACVDVMIHYPTKKMYEFVAKLGSLAEDRLILSFAPKTLYYQALKKVGDLFPGRSKATRAYLHAETDVLQALDEAGFKVQRKEMTATSFYFSRLLEAVRK